MKGDSNKILLINNMAGTLELNLNDFKNIDIQNQSKNIFSNIGEAFSNAMKKGTDQLKFPDDLGETVINNLQKIDLKDIGGKAAEIALKEGMKKLGISSTLFSSVKGVFKAINEGDLKGGLSSGINTALELAKLPKVAKTIIKEGKDLILDQALGDELKNVMKKQQNTISRIDKKCVQMEEAFKNGDSKTLDKVYKTLKSDMEKVMPIKDVIVRGNTILNRYELYKSKGTTELSSVELELIQKLV